MLKSKFAIYVLDTETTGLDPHLNEIIEVSFYRLNDDQQQTWFLKPSNYESIQADALRINGHKLEDLKGLTQFGKEHYIEPAKAIAEIENWFMDDLCTGRERIIVGQNPAFDQQFLQNLWQKHNAKETFPFGDRPFVLDTRQITLLLDLASGEETDYYSLNGLVEKYGVKKEKSHQAATDARMTKNVFLKQLEIVSKAFNK
jgi:DNA polymerase III epsilon subunit-like protein